jgi:DNA polymerase-3 subunit beta
MKFSVLQENLSKSLNVASRIVSSKPSLPILSNILIEVNKGKVKLSSTDLDIGMNTWITADSEVDGKTTVSAKTFADYINSLPAGKLDIELVGNQLNVKSKSSSASFNIIPADDFPAITEVEGDPVLNLLPGEFKEAIDQVVFSAAMDDARPALTGIQFESTGKNLAMIAVDGFRLSKKILQIEESLDNFSPLVPAKALLEFSKVLTDSAEEGEVVKVYELKEKSQIVLRFKEFDLVTRLDDAKFPDYKQIIPSEFKTKALIDRTELQNVVKIINIFARNVIGNKSIIDVNPEESKISIQAAMAEVGENQSEMQVMAEGDPLVVAFSAKYLNDMLNSVKSDFLVFECNGPTMPGVFKPADVKGSVDENYLHIIMPMRLE